MAALSLGLLILGAIVIQGWRAGSEVWLRGDAQFHAAMAAQVARGHILPEAYYAGVPSWYAPGYHWLVGVTATLLSVSPYTAIGVLSIVSIPLLPLTAYLLAERLGLPVGGRLAATALTTFAGGWNFVPERLWVFSFFPGAHNFYPLYPRDVSLALTPLVLVLLAEGLDGRLGRAALAGVVAGVAFLFQPQPIVSLGLAGAVWAILVVFAGPHELRRSRVLGLAVSALTALAVAGWWLLLIAVTATKAKLDVSSPFFQAPTLPLDSYLGEFGVTLPLAIAGAAIAWRAGSLLARLVTLSFVVPFVVGFLYRPGQPLGDYLGSDRMWLAASIPMAQLGAVFLVRVAQGRWRLAGVKAKPLQWLAVALLVVSATVPATWANWGQYESAFRSAAIGPFDTRPSNELSRVIRVATRAQDRNSIVVLGGPEASLNAWFNDGRQVVFLNAPSWSKIGFDPAKLTPSGQDDRGRDARAAFSGSLSALAAVARKYGASVVVLEEWEGMPALVDLQPGPSLETAGNATTIRNGWTEVIVEPGLPLTTKIRLDGASAGRLRLTAFACKGVELRLMVDGRVVAAGDAGPRWADVDMPIDLSAGAHELVIVSSRRCTVVRLRAYLDVHPESYGWRLLAREPGWIAIAPPGTP